MKKLTYDEFLRRMEEIQKARMIFIETGLTNNITRAFEVYQELLASEQMAVTISTLIDGSKPPSPLDDFIRPRCDLDNTELRLRVNTLDQNGKLWPTSWVCELCKTESYSEKTVDEWYVILKDETERQNNPG